MAYLPDFADNLAYMKGEEVPSTIQIAGGAGTPTSGISGSGVTPNTTNAPSQASQVPAAGRAAMIQPTATTGGVLGAYQTGIQTQQQDIAKALASFKEQAGPTRTFESIGGQQELQQAITAPTTQQDYAQQMEEAKNILGSTYTGPMNWTAETAKTAEEVTRIQKQQQELAEQSQALQSGYGVAGLVQKQQPGLTPGQLRYEAQQITQSPEYRSYKAQALADVGQTEQQIKTSAEQAAARAEERVGEEKAIGEAATGYLTGQRQDVVDQWSAAIAQKEADQAALDAAWKKFQETGSLEALQGIPEQARGNYIPGTLAGTATPWTEAQQWNPEQFNTIARQRLAQGEQTYADIMASPEYASIKDMPLLNIMIDSHGREQYDFSNVPAEQKTLMAGMIAKFGGGKQGQAALNDLLVKRQVELEEAGFSPGTVREKQRSGAGDMYKVGPEYGKYATYMPLYYAEGPEASKWVPEDYRWYLQYLPGSLPTRENLTTEDQATIYNNIETLLGEVDRISQSEPFAAATVAANVEQFLADEESVLSERKEALKGAAADWATTVKKMRRKYEKAKKAAAWGKVLRVITAVGTMGMSEIARAGAKNLPGTLGKMAGLANTALTYGTIGGLGAAALGAAPMLGPVGAIGLGAGIGQIPNVGDVVASSQGKNLNPKPQAEQKVTVKNSLGQ